MFPSPVTRRRPLLGVLVTLLLLSCRTSSAPETDAPGTSPSVSPETRAPFDMSAVMRQVHFAFRPEGGGWSGGHSTYGVRVDGQGLTLTPVAPSRAIRGDSPRAKANHAALMGASLSLGTLHWRRDGQPALEEKALTRVRLEQPGHLTLTRTGLVETLRNTEDGVRQEWAFPSEPTGKGDLLLTVSAKGLAYSGASEAGLHFQDARTGLGFQYGHPAWVDGSGRSTPLQARYVAGNIQLQVPAAVVASTTFPATVAPVISPELGMGNTVPGPIDAAQDEPAVASNGSGYFVAWQDYRQGHYEIYGTRITSDGAIQDTLGLQLSRGGNSLSRPKVASNGTDYLVVWHAVPESGNARVLASRIVASASEPDVTPFVVLPDEDSMQLAPSVASKGTDYLVAWMNGGSQQGLRGTRVSSTGTILDPAGLTLSTVGHSILPWTAMASNGTSYLVVWEDERQNSVGDIYGTRVTSAGVVEAPQGFAIAQGEWSHREPTVASNGTDYLVAWTDRRTDTEGDIRAARVTSTGTVLDDLPIATAPGLQGRPAVASDGANYQVIWTDGRNDGYLGELYATSVLSTGEVNAEGWRLSAFSSQYTGPALAFNGTNHLVIWSISYGGGALRAMRVTRQGQVLDENGFVVGMSASLQQTPVVASNGEGYLVVWEDSFQGGNNIIGTRVTSTGEVLDPTGLPIDLDTGNRGGSQPAVASNGTDYLVTWVALRAPETAIHGTRITQAGEVLSPHGRRYSPASQAHAAAPSVASNGTDYLVVAGIWNLEAEVWPLLGIRVSGDGEGVEALAQPICAHTGCDLWDTKVASNGSNYLVVWTDSRSSGNGTDIHGARVSGTGAVLEPEGIAIATAEDNRRNVAVASNGVDYLVAWSDFRRGSSSDVFGARVAGSGEVLDKDNIAISTATRWQHLPSITSLGGEYLVVWQDHRVSTPDPNIQGARVTAAGLVRDTAGFAIADGPNPEQTPVVVASDDGRGALVVYDHDDNVDPYWSHRIRARFVTFSDNRPPLASPGSASTPEDTPLTLVLQGSDPEGQSLTYELVSSPAHGTLSGTGASRTYTPADDYSGPDSFSFRVSDGELFSASATVTLTVTPVNDMPSVPVLRAPVDGAPLTSGFVTFEWQASTDADGDSLAYELEIFQGSNRRHLLRTTETTASLVAGEALSPGDYSWSVKAVDSHDLASAASPVRAFTIEEKDAGTVDAGVETDAGTVDAGVEADAGTVDAGVETDAGTVDAGTESDGGSSDGGPIDSGVADAGPQEPPTGNPPESSGCGCNPVPGTAPVAPLLMAALGLLARGSRRRR
ncbi:cadherin-like domain-containing protein [Pyxidicoccus parkwayensis]|uniref:Cadherin-like domain-containing protein n=1 Tax=Pyxidicoccus parkwayensis TaxID=2813578 RepID=A0ABX7NZJ5_9BACT|nr:cadherin-like domain-containing protein [Pyxidicoccus parkwaysis]QSQ24342.1 cadherin-like domain-containing protein [Pyxidicoccus parkwaysis]